jgi:hypothetical protein
MIKELTRSVQKSERNFTDNKLKSFLNKSLDSFEKGNNGTLSINILNESICSWSKPE